MDMERIKKLLNPTLIEVSFCFVGAIIIISIFHFNEILSAISQSSLVSTAEISHSYQAQLEQLDKFVVLRTLVLVAFWAAVGLVAYMVYLVVSRVMTDIRNEVVITTQFANRGRFESILLPAVVHIALAITFIFSLWLSYIIGLSFWLGLVEALLYNANWLAGLVGFCGLAANLYILWVQFRLVQIGELS